MQETEFRRLQTAYRNAWHHLVIAVDLWQSQQLKSLAAQETEFLVERANRLYQESRNELADYMLSKMSKDYSKSARFRLRAESFSDPSACVTSACGRSMPAA